MGWGPEIVLLAMACSGGPDSVGAVELILDGPARVSVDQLGPVEGPRAIGPAGQTVPEVTWTAEPATVAVVHEGVVSAVGPGQATVIGEADGAEVSWTLVVEPTITLQFVEPPATLSIGDSMSLEIESRMGGQDVELPEVVWSSSHPDVAWITETGEVRAVAPGITYVTVAGSTSQAMLELEVVAP